MVKVITIKDDVYERLRKIKNRKNMSFSNILDLLITTYESKNSKQEIEQLAGSIKERDINKRMLKRLMKYGKNNY